MLKRVLDFLGMQEDGMLVDIHIEVKDHLTVFEGHDIAYSVGQKLRMFSHVLDVQVHVNSV